MLIRYAVRYADVRSSRPFLRLKAKKIDNIVNSKRETAGKPYFTEQRSQKLSMLELGIQAGRSQSFRPMPKSGCCTTDADPYCHIANRYQYDPESNTKRLTKIFSRDLLATSWVRMP